MPANNPNDGRRIGDPCPACTEGKLYIRSNTVTKGYFLGCNTFPVCDWACNPMPGDLSDWRESRRLNRLSYKTRGTELLEARWAIEDERGRQALQDEICGEPEPVYSWWDALMDGKIV